ncbi:MAG TPA: addiction module protein [Polyangiaceae bacterium]|jgi:hypothetical protein|nr:addiction module protein [Polyangiaceae bacterium]
MSAERDETDDMLAEALRLPEDRRVKLATDLLRSVEGPPDTVDDEAWLAELRQRAERVLCGEAKGRPWTEVRDALLADIRR